MIRTTCANCQSVCTLDDIQAGCYYRCQSCGTSQIVPTHLRSSFEPTEVEAAPIAADPDAIDEQPGLSRLIGQDSFKNSLRQQIAQARSRDASLPHLLICGPPGRGKRTFAQAIAHEMGVQCHVISANSINNAGEFVGVFTKLDPADVFLISDIENLSEGVLTHLVQAVEDFKIDITLDAGLQARTVTMPIPPFTLIGTTSKPSRIDPTLSEWITSYDLEPYNSGQLMAILSVIATREGLTLAPDAASLLSRLADCTPRRMFVLLKRLKTLNYHDRGYISFETASAGLSSLGYDPAFGKSRDLFKKLKVMPAAEFERFVADVFHRLGYAAELTAQSGDHGIDIILRKLGTITVVQCKQWDSAVGEPVLRDFYGSMISVSADCGFVVTTSNFTAQANAFARNKPIKLYDIDALVELCIDVGQASSTVQETDLFGDE